MQWYYALNGTRNGPVAQEQFDQLVQAGTITPETLVWRAGMQAWLPWRDVLAQAGAAPGAAAGAPGAPEAAIDADSARCAVSGRVFPKRDMLEYNGQWISAEHKDEFFQRLREGLPMAGEMRYVGFWYRFLAVIIDGIILWVIGLPVQLILGLGILGEGAVGSRPETMMLANMLNMLIGTIIGICFDVFFIRKFDATPGKMAIGAKVVRSDGSKLSVGRIIGRYFSKLVSAIILGIGYMMAGWDSEKRALHDHMCDTRVVKK